MKVRVNTCCGCCDLHIGTLIIGICGILFSAGGIISHTAGLQNIENETLKTEMKVAIGYSYLYIVVNALLIYGAIKGSRYFLLPWLIYVAVGLGVLTAASLILTFFDPVMIIITLICAVMWYIWICVMSYFNEMNPTNPPPESVYPGFTDVSTMAPTIVTYVPQAPAYVAVGKGPEVV